MGSVVLSVDAELGWGFHDLESPPTDRLAAAREGWQHLLALCEEYDVPATWAIVGHLFLRDCDGWHHDHPTPRGWFDHERGTDRLSRSLRFGDGLVEATLSADADHELASHTFSHVEFGAPETTREIAAAELEATNRVARRRGVELRTLVFPRNNVGHRRVLREHGIQCYRGVQPSSGALAAEFGPVTKLRRVLGSASPPLVTPEVERTGLVNLPASLYLFGFEGFARTLASPLVGDPVLVQARRGIEKAVADDGIFHMWLHPNNVRAPRDVARIRTLFSYLDRRRTETDLEIKTMAQVATEAVDEVDLVRQAPEIT